MIIGICDDEVRDRERIQSVCTKVLTESFIEGEILLYSNGEDFLQCEKETDILILDIEMPGMNGIEVKDRLQQMTKMPLIIFATDHDELVLSAFGMNVYGFVIKNILDYQLPGILKSALSMLLNYKIIDNTIDSRDVMYIKSEHMYSKLFLKEGESHLLRMSLTELENLLSDVGFVRTHRSYLVNCKWISRIGEKEIRMEQERISVSVRLRGEVRRKYNEYCEKNARYC